MCFPFEPIGPLVDYHGWVRPYLLDLDGLDRSLLTHAPEIYDLFHTPLDQRGLASPAVPGRRRGSGTGTRAA
jgi:hypothetical protein